MSPVADTISAMYDRAPEAFWAWVLFGLAPVLVPALVSIFVKSPPTSRIGFTLSSAARLLGWPVLAIGLIGLPWFVFELFLVPVLLDAYPMSRAILAAPLAVTRWFVDVSFLLLPVLWVTWLLLGTLRFRRAWREKQVAG
jgi:hypothetical protein